MNKVEQTEFDWLQVRHASKDVKSALDEFARMYSLRGEEILWVALVRAVSRGEQITRSAAAELVGEMDFMRTGERS